VVLFFLFALACKSMPPPRAESSLKAADKTDAMNRIQGNLALAAQNLAAAKGFGPSDTPGSVVILRVIPEGPGCPDGTTSHLISPDGMVFSMLFDQFYAELLTDPLEGEKTSSCLVSVEISYPKNLEMVILDAEAVGFYSLAGDPEVTSDVTASQASTYTLQNQAGVDGLPAGPFISTWQSPPNENSFSVPDQLFLQVPQDCTGYVKLKIDLNLKLTRQPQEELPKQYGYIAIDSHAGQFAPPASLNKDLYHAMFFGFKPSAVACPEEHRIFLPIIQK
jgi:hypothetical protein